MIINYTTNFDRECWRQGMLDAAALIKCPNYLVVMKVLNPLNNSTLYDFREKIRDDLEAIIKRYVDNPEQSITPLLPISPEMVRRIRSLKG